MRAAVSGGAGFEAPVGLGVSGGWEGGRGIAIRFLLEAFTLSCVTLLRADRWVLRVSRHSKFQKGL